MRNDIKKKSMFAGMSFLSTRYAYYLAQIMPKFMKNFGMTFAKKNGHIERLKFTGMEMNQHSGVT